MGKTRLAIVALIFVILFVSTISGIIAYYNDKVLNLESQVSSLRKQIIYLTSANLTSNLSVQEISTQTQYPNGTHLPPNLFVGYPNHYINGSVTNEGGAIAFNAGLHVSAYTADGTLVVNMTVPLINGAWVYGTDAITDAFVSNHFQDNLGTFQLGYLKSGQSVTFYLNFYHENNVGNWTITPVWTNSP
jgi:hypothetical protein